VRLRPSRRAPIEAAVSVTDPGERDSNRRSAACLNVSGAAGKRLQPPQRLGLGLATFARHIVEFTTAARSPPKRRIGQRSQFHLLLATAPKPRLPGDATRANPRTYDPAAPPHARGRRAGLSRKRGRSDGVTVTVKAVGHAWTGVQCKRV